MSVARFCARVAGAKLDEADRKWFPRWIRSCASGLKIAEGDLRGCKELGQAPSRPSIFRDFRGSHSEPVPFFHSLSALPRRI
jgi:hypothetical protein